MALVRLAETTAGTARLSLPGGYEAVREYERLRLDARGPAHVCEPVVLRVGSSATFCGRAFRAGLMADGRSIAAGRGAPQGADVGSLDGSTGDASLLGARGSGLALAGGEVGLFGLAAPTDAILLRHPHPGDAFQPFGMSATVSLSRFLAAAKVPARDRERAVVAEIDGALAWVSTVAGTVGRIAEPFRVASQTRVVLRLTEETAGQ